jgi:hypothetical protein
MQLSNFAPYYGASVNLPDIVVYNSEIVKSDEQGVVFTGYFGNDWSVDKGDFFVNGQL